MRLFTIATLGVLTATSIATSGCAALMANLHHEYVETPPANDFQKSLAGKIVFSTQDIPDTIASADTLATSFKLETPVFARTFYPHNPLKLIHDAGKQCHDNEHNFIIEIRDADGPADTWTNFSSDSDSVGVNDARFVQWTTSSLGVLLGKTSKEERPLGFANKLLTYLIAVGRNTINLEFRLSINCDGADAQGKSMKQAPIELARGKSSFTLTDESIAKYVVANGMKMKSSPFADKAAAKHIDVTARTIHEFDGKPVLAVFMDQGDWTYDRNEYGRILSRSAYGTAVAGDGRSCTRIDFRAVEANTGLNTYVTKPTVQPDGSYGFSPIAIPCVAMPGK